MTVVLANGGGSETRPATDFYPTPATVTHALLDFLKLPTSTAIWEPAAGQGHMVNVFRERGYQTFASGLYSMAEHVDFCMKSDIPADWIITNPPFNQAEAFIRHARSLDRKGFAFLLKSQYWHASRRLALFNEIRPTHVLPLTWRPDFLFGAKSSAPTMEVLWSVWQWPYNQTATEYIPLTRTAS